MIHVEPLSVGDRTFLGIEVMLPRTTLIAIRSDKGYIMCGALDVQLLNDKLQERKIVAGRATGVRNLHELLDAPLESVTLEAEQRGIHPGMKGRDALLKMV